MEIEVTPEARDFAHVNLEQYEAMYAESIANPEAFWEQ
jgi:hypothetical protein